MDHLHEAPATLQRNTIFSKITRTSSYAKEKAYNTCRAPQAATATSEALVMSQAKLA